MIYIYQMDSIDDMNTEVATATATATATAIATNKPSKKISLIAACTSVGGIGLYNTIPWKIQEDMRMFFDITTNTGNVCNVVPEIVKGPMDVDIEEDSDIVKQNAVIMGKNTWLSLPKKPLRKRFNFIISGTLEPYLTEDQLVHPDIKVFKNFEDCFSYCQNNNQIDNLFCIGGECLYDYILKHKADIIKDVQISELKEHIECNKFIDIDYIRKNFNRVIELREYTDYVFYKRIPNDDIVVNLVEDLDRFSI
jgi:dihydrofolate reductase